MNFLHFPEGIRVPFGDAFFFTVTHLGEEALFIVIGLLFFWCVNKREGYYLAVGLIATVLNQFLKLVFRIPRPWVKDSSFTIVESTRAEATGYSFPSGYLAYQFIGGVLILRIYSACPRCYFRKYPHCRTA